MLADLNGIIKAFNSKSKEIIFLNIGREIQVGGNILDFIQESRRDVFKDIILKVLEGQTLRYDYAYNRKNGETKWYNFAINPVYKAGKIEGLSIASADITERKITEELLQNSQSNLKAIIENTDASIYSLDRDFRYITFNQRLKNSMIEIYGLEVHPGEKVFDFLKKLSPAEAVEWQQAYTSALGGETVKFEREFNVEGFHSCVSFSIYPIWENEVIIGLSCFALDITKQKKAEQIQRQTELRYRQIVETTQEGVWLIDEKNATTFVNNKMCSILEYSSEEMLGEEIFYFMDEQAKEESFRSMERRKMGVAENIEMRYITKSGKEVWTTISANPIFDGEGIYRGALGMVTDITEKKDLENLLNKINDLARIGSWEIDLINNTMFWSSTSKQIHGVPDDFVPDVNATLGLYKEGWSRQSLYDALQMAINDGAAFDLELLIVTPDHAERWFV